MKVDAAPDILNAWVRWRVVNPILITTFIYHHVIIITMDDIDQSMVYFVCGVCGFTFQSDPNFIPITCPQCGSENVART